MDSDTHFDLNDQQKTRLFSLGYREEAKEVSEDTNETRCDLLYEIIVSPLPLPPQTVNSVPDVLKSMAGDLVSIAGKPVGQLLTEAESSLGTLEKIKVYAKYKGTHTTEEATKDAYMAVYFAAIARAFVLYGVTMSQHRPDDLVRFFRTYEKSSWVLQELKEVFSMAAGNLLQRSNH